MWHRLREGTAALGAVLHIDAHAIMILQQSHCVNLGLGGSPIQEIGHEIVAINGVLKRS